MGFVASMWYFDFDNLSKSLQALHFVGIVGFFVKCMYHLFYGVIFKSIAGVPKAKTNPDAAVLEYYRRCFSDGSRVEAYASLSDGAKNTFLSTDGFRQYWTDTKRTIEREAARILVGADSFEYTVSTVECVEDSNNSRDYKVELQVIALMGRSRDNKKKEVRILYQDVCEIVRQDDRWFVDQGEWKGRMVSIIAKHGDTWVNHAFVTCRHCNADLQVPDKHMGTTISCPVCKEAIEINRVKK